MEETTDLLGNTVKKGDRVAVAFRSGNTSELRVGVVDGFSSVKAAYAYGHEDDREHTLVVAWSHGYQKGKKTGIWISRRQFVKIGNDA